MYAPCFPVDSRAMRERAWQWRRQSGVSMFISLILLSVITIITMVAARTTLLEVLMAGNEQKRITAFEKAEAGIHALYDARIEVVDFNLGLNATDCTSNINGCTQNTLTLPANGFGNDSYAKVTRVGEAPLVCPPAWLEISCTDAKAAFFEFQSQYDARGSNGGNITLTQGVLSILPDQE